METMILALAFFGVMVFVLVGVDLFGKGWESYEDRYVKGAEKSLDSMFLTIPAQHLLYLSFLCYVLVGVVVTIVTGKFELGGILGIAGFFIPQVGLKLFKKMRDEKFGLQLVDALSSMANALSAGLSLPQAIDAVARDMESPIRQEFKMLSHELRLGTKLEHALNNFQKRMPNPDLILMNTAITISSEVGGNLSEVFRNISTTVRERNRLEANIKAHTSQGKMQGYVLCLIPFGIGGFLTVAYPAMMEPLYNTPVGWAVLIFSAVWMLIGSFFISRIIRIDI